MDGRAHFGPLLVSMLFAFAFLGIASAAGGTSSVTLSSYNGSIKPGGLLASNYTISLTNGTYGGTDMAVLDNSTLASAGITVQLNTGLDDPTYSGRMLIYASYNATPGFYNVTLKASGYDPSPSVNFALTVLYKNGTVPVATTTVPNTTTAATTSPTSTTQQATTTPTSTTAQSTSQPAQSTGTSYYIAVVVVVIIIIGAAYYLFKVRGKGQPGPAMAK